MVRAKFTVSSITDYGNNNQMVKLTCIYDDTIPEDQRFNKATPYGEITMGITVPEVLKQFAIGKKFYADFTEVAPA